MTAETKPCASDRCGETLTRRPGEYLSHWDARNHHSVACGRWGVRPPETKVCKLDTCGATFTRPPGLHRNRWERIDYCTAEHGGGTRCGPRKPPPRRVADQPATPATRRIPPTPVTALPSWRPAGFTPQPLIGAVA